MPHSPEEAPIRAHFLSQASSCERLGSPFTAALCRILAEILDRGTAVGRRILEWPGDPASDALALRLCGGLHHLVLSGADPALAAVYPPHPLVEDLLRDEVSRVLATSKRGLLGALGGPPQTNEIARAAMLYPGFLAIARQTGLPLQVRELGASAGLNTLFDNFCYHYGPLTMGKIDSPVQLAPEVIGPSPPLGGKLTVLDRAAADIAPVDLIDEANRLRLRSFIWADQRVRLARFDAAVTLARDAGVQVEQASAADFVERSLERRQPGTAFVLFHSIMWQYLMFRERQRIGEALEATAANVTAPVAWLRMEPLDTNDPHATLSLTLWPDGSTRHLARCDYHGRWIEWMETTV